MKPFDLDAAKRGEPIQTRDGRPAKFIAHVPEAVERKRVIALLGRDVVFTTDDGATTNGVDLFMAPKKRTVWFNLYEGQSVAEVHRSKYEADRRGGDDRIGGKAWPLEIEE